MVTQFSIVCQFCVFVYNQTTINDWSWNTKLSSKQIKEEELEEEKNIECQTKYGAIVVNSGTIYFFL